MPCSSLRRDWFSNVRGDLLAGIVVALGDHGVRERACDPYIHRATARVDRGARQHAADVGVTQLEARLRHGELVDAVVEMEPDARLFVLGEHRRAASCSRLHLDHRVEQVIRAVKRPVLVVTNDRFEAPQRVVLAYDGSAAARKAVETVARSPFLAGLPVVIVMAGSDEHKARGQLDQAYGLLADAGFSAETALLAFIQTQTAALVVMDTYSHSRLRSFFMGSITTMQNTSQESKAYPQYLSNSGQPEISANTSTAPASSSSPDRSPPSTRAQPAR